ncbi:MAG: hypothetical protein ACOC9V_06130 [Chloroflexota bacterium]
MNRDRQRHQRIDRAAAFRRRTGLCVICRRRPADPGMTCGRKRCIRAWLRGRLPKVEIHVDHVEVV